MYKPFIKNTLAKLAILSVISFSFQVSAITEDAEQEILIKAKKQAADLKNKIASYIDDVEITQGSLAINADLVQIISQKNTVDKIYVAKGKPARFQQTLDDGSVVVLEAKEIRYEPALFIVEIKGNAKVSQEGSEVSGEKIIYNIKTEQLEAEGANSGTVTTILQPKAKGE